MDNIFDESLDLLEDMKHISGGDTGEIEYENIMIEAERGGITRTIKYKAHDAGRQLKFEYLGKVLLIDMPAMISSRKDLFEFITSLLQELNEAVHPASFVNTGKKEAEEKIAAGEPEEISKKDIEAEIKKAEEEAEEEEE